jgi:UDP-glucuronate 4-epimerase
MDQDPETLATMFGDSQVLIHLAAFPGIRMGELKSHEYLINNVGNSSLIIEACKLNDSVKAIIFASSSSVYGDQGFENPCKEDQVDPMQLKSQYAMTKLINEIQFQRAAKTLNIPIIGLRFFTVFGEWGRPDMAYSKFTNSILTGKRVQIYGPDGGYRNMTHVDDVVEIMIRLIKLIKTKNFVLESNYEVFNLASDKIIQTKELAQKIGSILNMQVNFDIVNRPKGDAIGTRANLEKISQFIGKLNPRNFDDDLKNYVKWHVIHQKLFNLI